MAFLACNHPTIVVTGEVTSPSNTANIDIRRFGARSCRDSSSEPAINDAHQVQGPFPTYSPDALFQLNQFSSSDNNSFNDTTSQAPPQRSFFIPSSPESIPSDFGADESPSSTYDHFASPFPSSLSHFGDLGFASPGSSQEPLNDRLIQMTLHDTASSISQNRDGIGNLLRSDGTWGGFPPSYHGLRQPQLNQLHSPLIVQVPNVGSNNGLGLTFGNGYTRGTPEPEPFFVGQGQTSSHPHAPLSPITPFSPDPRTRPSHALPPLGVGNSIELSVGPSFAPADHTEDWAYSLSLSSFSPSTQGMDANDELPGGPYSATTEDGVHFTSFPGCGFPPTGVHVDRGLSVEPYPAPASYSGDEAHILPHSSSCLSPQGVNVGHGPSDGPCSAPASFTEDGTHLPRRSSWNLPPPWMGNDNGLSNEPYFAVASYVEGEAHFPSHSSGGFPPQGVDVSHGLFGGRYPAPERYTEEGSHFPSRFSRDLPSHTVDVGHGLSDGPCSAPASFTEGGIHSFNLPHPGMDASNGLSNGPDFAPASHVEDEAHFLSNFLPSHTSASSTFQSFFDDEGRDPVHDTVAAASSSAVSGWPGDATVLSSLPKKTVSSAKLRTASEKRRKKPGKFRCALCGNTFTEKHNLTNHHNSHRGVKPHSCERCPSAFAVRSSLTRHRKSCKQTKLS